MNADFLKNFTSIRRKAGEDKTGPAEDGKTNFDLNLGVGIV
jgi:hypothetical protein